jgi:hypothetical protein
MVTIQSCTTYSTNPTLHIPFHAMSFRSLLSSLRLPATLSSVSLTQLRTQSSQAQSQLQASTSHFLPRHPSPSAVRESPYPLVFLRTPGISDPSAPEVEDWSGWSSMFAEKGYTSIEIDVVPAPYASKPFAGMVGVLATQIRTLGIPFGPVIIASGRAGLLAQAYVEDWAATGLVLINPPPDVDPRPAAASPSGEEGGAGLAWEWPEFRYEPHFPILVLGEQGQMGRLEKENRIVRAAQDGVGRGGKGVSVAALVDGERGDQSRVVSVRCAQCRRVTRG